MNYFYIYSLVISNKGKQYIIIYLMFLLNLFGKSSGENEQQRFDKISFKINLKDNVPQFHDWSAQHFQQEEELTPDHPLYYTIFPKEEEIYVHYTVSQNDTLFGIALKLNIGESIIKQINNISGNIYPGMNIKLPEDTDLTKLEQFTSDQTAKMRISELLKVPEKSQYINLKYNVQYYVGLSGHIKGNLTINSNYLIFNPSLDDTNNIQNFTVQRLLKFNAIVETVDIQDVIFMEIPKMGDSEVPKNIAVIQFLLYRVGNYKIQKKYKQKLKQLKLDHKAIASMSFTVLEGQEKSSREIANELVDKVKLMLKELSEKEVDKEQSIEKNRLTNIPFFDIIHENINPKAAEEKVEMNKVLHKSAILGTLNEPSQVLTAEEFHYVIEQVPVIYKLSNWVKAYSKTRDGTSFISFLSNTSNVQPAFLLIKEYKGYRFGAYLTSEIKYGKSGRGQMFIFTFKDKEVPEIYPWTGKNESFVFFDKQDGLGIGMGFKYGIWIKNDFYKGSTSHTKTFGNTQILSKKEDFLIQEIQIWGVDLSY